MIDGDIKIFFNNLKTNSVYISNTKSREKLKSSILFEECGS